MAAAEIVEIKRVEPHPVWVLVKAQCTTAGGDWVVLNGYKGVIPVGTGICQNIASSAASALTYGVITINGAAQNTTTNTTFVCTAATITRSMPYYILTASGEIMEVLTDSNVASSTPTLTVRRGCLGTTPSATGLADTEVLGIMNIIFMAGARIGPHIFVTQMLPQDAFYTNADGGAR